MKHVATKTEWDRLVIEAVVRRFGPLSRVAIHELTHLEPSRISRLVHELLDEGKILAAGRADNPMGRKQILLRLNENHSFVIGVGFDDEKVMAAVMDLQPRIRAMVEEPTRLDGGAEGLIAQLRDCSRSALDQAGVEPGRLLGVGLGGSGLMDKRAGTLVMSSTIEFLRHAPLERIFELEFAVPVTVENLTRAKAVAERMLGAGQMAADMIYVEYGHTGIGAGIVAGGELVYGSGFAAGEFGHTHMMEDGPACKCGSFGCLEAIAGASVLEARIRKAIAEGSGTCALSLAGGHPEKISGWTVLKAASMGDKTCTAITEQMANYLGLGVANLVNLFNPSVLVLDQRLSLAGDDFLGQITKVIKRQALVYSTDRLQVRFGELGDEASVLGIGSILLEKHFEIPALKPPRFMIESLPMSAERPLKAEPETASSRAPSRLPRGVTRSA
jgi:N-acetylglucosamine repressor